MLLDTHALLWLSAGVPLHPDAQHALSQGEVLVSAVTAWEIATLVRKRRITLDLPLRDWFARAVAKIGVSDLVPLTSAIALATAELPNPLHDDPADRLLIATARDLDVPLVTRDARILAYAAAGHVRAIAC